MASPITLILDLTYSSEDKSKKIVFAFLVSYIPYKGIKSK